MRYGLLKAVFALKWNLRRPSFLLFLSLLLLNPGSWASSAGGQNLDTFYHPQEWVVVTTRNNVTYHVGENVSLTLHVFHGGIRRDLTNLTMGVEALENGTYRPRTVLKQVNVTWISIGQYRVNFNLTEDMVQDRRFYPLSFSDDLPCFQLSVNSLEYWDTNHQYYPDTPYYQEEPFLIPLDYRPVPYEIRTIDRYDVQVSIIEPNSLDFMDKDLGFMVRGVYNNTPFPVKEAHLKVNGKGVALEKVGEGRFLGFLPIPRFNSLLYKLEYEAVAFFETSNGTVEASNERMGDEAYHLFSTNVWTRWKNLKKYSAELEVRVENHLGNPLGASEVTIEYFYWSNQDSKDFSGITNGHTDGQGKAILNIDFPDRDNDLSLEYQILIDGEELFPRGPDHHSFPALDADEKPVEPYLSIVREADWIIISKYDEPYRKTVKLDRKVEDMPEGSKIQTLVISPFRVLHEQEYITDKNGTFELIFTPTQGNFSRYGESMNLLTVLYYNNSGKIEYTEYFGVPYAITNDNIFQDYFYSWDNVTLEAPNSQNELIAGKNTKLRLVLPEDFKLVSVGWNHVDIQWYSTSWDARFDYERPFEFNQDSGENEVNVYLPRFIAGEDIPIYLSLRVEKNGAQFSVFKIIEFPTVASNDIKHTVWVGTSTDEWIARFILLGLTMFVILMITQGQYREKRKERIEKARALAREKMALTEDTVPNHDLTSPEAVGLIDTHPNGKDNLKWQPELPPVPRDKR